MFTDLVGYSALAQADEQRALQLVEDAQKLIRPILETYHGREVKSTGDGFLIEFESARDGVLCAIEIQERIHLRNQSAGVSPLLIRIGMHLGDVEPKGSDILGDAVNIASRIEPVAEPGGICLSPQVYDQIKNKVSVQLERLDPRSLKGIREPLEIYRVVMPWNAGRGHAGDPSAPRLAVLPLANISPDPSDAYLADGLTEELIAVLSQIRGLRVIARTSVGQYRTATKPIAVIGQELGVSSVLEGSVRKAGNRLRVTLQLIDVTSQEHTWAVSFNRELDDVFEIQAEIAERTAQALRLQLLPSEQAAIRRPPTANLEAYHLYLRGLHAFQEFEHDRGEKLLEAAIRLDPQFVQAQAELINVLIGAYGDTRPKSAVESRAKELIGKVLSLNPNSSGAHVANGNSAFQFDLDWVRAEVEFRTAIELNPSDPSAHYWYAIMCMTLQRYDDALEQLALYSQLDPANTNAYAIASGVCRLAGNYPAAVEAALHCAAQRTEGHSLLAHIHGECGRMDEARKEAQLAFDLLRAKGPLQPYDEYYIARTRAWLFGSPVEARALLEKWKADSADPLTDRPYVPRLLSAGLYSLLREHDTALALIEEDTSVGDRTLWFHYQSTVFDSLRADPRFVALLRAMKLPTSTPWKRSTMPSSPVG